jgi:hypothetical protein
MFDVVSEKTPILPKEASAYGYGKPVDRRLPGDHHAAVINARQLPKRCKMKTRTRFSNGSVRMRNGRPLFGVLER